MIGIYGGTFNPVHYGHLRTALEVRQLFQLQALHLVPCREPPHRQSPDVTAAERLQMLQLAIANTAGFVADDRELQRPGPSYMVDTLKSFRQQMPEQALLLFIGADAFLGLERWYHWQQLFDYAHVVVMMRPGFSIEVTSAFLRQRVLNHADGLASQLAGSLFFQVVTQLDISATQIRRMIAVGENPQFLLPDSVINFIQQHKLYQAAPKLQDNECKVMS